MKKLIQSPWFSSCLAGVLLSFSYPNHGSPFLLFPAFIVLFNLAEKADSGKQVAYWTYPAFVIWNLITTYWLMFATVGGGAAAILANAVLMTIPLAWMRRVLHAKWNYAFKALGLAALWTTYEFLHFNWDLAWPWLSLGNAFGDYPKLIQFIEYTGQLGITFSVVFVSGLLYEIIVKQWHLVAEKQIPWWTLLLSFQTKRDSEKVVYGGWILLFLLGLVTLSNSLYSLSENANQTYAEIAVVQPNFDSYLDDAGFSSYEASQENLLSLADSARTPQTKLILFPENSIQPLVNLQSYFVKQFSDSAIAWNLSMISGLNELVDYNPKTAPKVYRGMRFNRPFDVFNSSMIWEANGNVKPYRKYNLVPIVERMPFVNFFATIDVINWVNWGSFAGFGKGLEVVTAPFDGGIASVLICYDSVFPDWSRRYVLQGATVLGIITNDGWWGDTPGHEQHFSFGRLRAIESRRAIARSANNGISGFILPNGEVLQRSTYWTRTVERASVPLRTDLTFYVKYGDWIGWLSLIITGLVIFTKKKAN